MSEMRRLLEAVSKTEFAGEKKGQKPGQYWKGTDKKTPGTKLVGEESIIGELNQAAKDTSLERRLKEAYNAFKEEEPEADYGPKYQAMVKRVGQTAKQGPLKTVYDPEKRVYKNVPVNKEKQVKEYGNAQNPDAQTTTPGASGSAQADQENDMGAKLGAAATQKNIAQLKTIDPNLNPQISKTALGKVDQPNMQMTGAELGQTRELVSLLEPALSDPQIGSQVTTLLRKAGQQQKARTV